MNGLARSIVILAAVAAYCVVVAFIGWGFDPASWSVSARFWFITFGAVVAYFSWLFTE